MRRDDRKGIARRDYPTGPRAVCEEVKFDASIPALAGREAVLVTPRQDAIERTHGAVLLWGRPLNNDLEAELEV
jgi:hypothetical protein